MGGPGARVPGGTVTPAGGRDRSLKGLDAGSRCPKVGAGPPVRGAGSPGGLLEGSKVSQRWCGPALRGVGPRPGGVGCRLQWSWGW